MDVFQMALVVGTVIVALITADNRRALGWLAIGVADFIVCALYQDSGATLVPYPMFVGLVDASVCLAIYTLGRYQLEIWLFRAFQLSVLFSVLRLFGVIETNYAYVAMLELANWIALLIIGGAHLLRHANGLGLLGNHPRDRVRRAYRALFSERAHPPFGRAP